MTAPKASLIVEDERRTELDLDGTPLLIGSGAVCKVVLKGNGCASFTHAELKLEGGDYILHDLGTRDGTRVNGNRIDRHALRNGDRILIGGVKITFVKPMIEAPTPPPGSLTPLAPPPPKKAIGESTDRLPTPFLQEEVAAEAEHERRQLLWIGGATLASVLGFFLMLPLFLSDDGAVPTRSGRVVRWVQVKTEVGNAAYVTLQHASVSSLDDGVARASSSQDSRSQITIEGVATGTTKVHAVGARGHVWEIDVLVTAKEKWPPGWTDEARLEAASRLCAEADALYADKAAREMNLVPCYYRYAKILRMYDNCKYAPPTPYERARECKEELEKVITAKEIHHSRELWRTFRLGELTITREHLNRLLGLFPPDGGDEQPMAGHGNNQKNQQYFVLGLKLDELARHER